MHFMTSKKTLPGPSAASHSEVCGLLARVFLLSFSFPEGAAGDFLHLPVGFSEAVFANPVVKINPVLEAVCCCFCDLLAACKGCCKLCHLFVLLWFCVVSCIPCLKHEYCLISGDLHIKRAIPPAFVYNVHRQTHIIEKRGIAHGHYTVITFNHQ